MTSLDSVRELMAKNPNQRIPTAGQLAFELAAIRKSLLEPSRTVPATPPMTPKPAVVAPSPPPPPAAAPATDLNSMLDSFAQEGNSWTQPDQPPAPPDSSPAVAIDDVAGLAAAFQSNSNTAPRATAKPPPVSQKRQQVLIGAAVAGLVGRRSHLSDASR